MPPNYRNDVEISYTPTAQSNFVRFPDTDKNVDSAFFKEHFEASAYMCKVNLILFLFFQILRFKVEIFFKR